MRTNKQSRRVSVHKPEVCTVPCFKEELVAEIRGWLPTEHEVRRVATLYAALADPTRLKILLALSRGELCVCDISHVVGLSVSATSHQLRVLRNLGLVNCRNDGKMAYYSVPTDGHVLAWIERAFEQQEQCGELSNVGRPNPCRSRPGDV